MSHTDTITTYLRNNVYIPDIYMYIRHVYEQTLLITSLISGEDWYPPILSVSRVGRLLASCPVLR